MESDDVQDEPTLEEEAPATEGKAPKRFSQRKVKMAIVLLVVAVVVVVLLWGMVPERIYEVRETVDDIDSLEGEYINVKGVIVNWDTESNNFTLADSNDENLTILVKHSGPIPEGFGLNVTAVIKGVIHQVGGKLRMDSDQIQIGCPSKY